MKIFSSVLILFVVNAITACQPDISSIEADARWQITNQPLVDAKLSADGAYSALLLSDNSLQLWHNNSQQQVAQWDFEQLANDTYLLSITDNAEFALTSNGQQVQVWHVEAAEPLGSLDFAAHLGDAKITQIEFWQAPERIFVGTSAGTIIFADTQNNTYRVNQSHNGEVTKFVLREDKLALFSAGNDGNVIEWDLNRYEPIASKSLPFRITSLAINNDGLVFISDALNKQILWDSRQNIEVGELSYYSQYKWFREALFTSQQPWLITSSPKTDMYLWSLHDFTIQGQWSVETQSLGSTVEAFILLSPTQLRSLTSDAVLQDWRLDPFVSQP